MEVQTREFEEFCRLVDMARHELKTPHLGEGGRRKLAYKLNIYLVRYRLLLNEEHKKTS